MEEIIITLADGQTVKITKNANYWRFIRALADLVEYEQQAINAPVPAVG